MAICKDCQPIFYTAAELEAWRVTLQSNGLVLKHVALCPRHSEVESLLGARIAIEEEQRIERRRYALLQAAATILSGSLIIREGGPLGYWENKETAVNGAGELLEEIEKREKAES